MLGYDEAKDTEELLNDGVVKFSLGKVKSERKGDIRLLYNASSFSPLALTEEKEMRETLIDEIERDRKKQDCKEKRTERLKRMGAFYFHSSV